MFSIFEFLIAFILFVLNLPLGQSEQTPLDHDWQQQVLTPGLEEHDILNTGCVHACQSLEHLHPGNEPTHDSTTKYMRTEYYWSTRQSEVSPRCFILPRSPKEVAEIVELVRDTNCPFAVKSGGHGAFAGASNIEAGITIDLRLLNELTLSEDRQTTRVGPGNRWIDVYGYLTPKNVSVLGGRVAEVGVGGFTLGGGISFFAPNYGWALDGVHNYELVTADGNILQVNRETTPDLYWALRGGGNNFGIVTRFDFETFEQGPMWGGVVYNDVQYAEDVIDAFSAFAHSEPQDPDAHAYIFLDFTHDRARLRAGSVVAYSKPVENPPALQNFTIIPSVQSSVRFTDVTGLTQELNDLNPSQLRWSYSTATFFFSREMLQICLDVFTEESQRIEHLEGVVPVLVLQLITKDTTSRFTRNGGNCLGIADGEGPLLLVNFPVKWQNKADDNAVLGTARRIHERTVQKAKELGLFHRYLYQNYADGGQDVFASYGPDNLERLREISKKYDPEQVFQRLQPGYFKLQGSIPSMGNCQKIQNCDNLYTKAINIAHFWV